MQVVLVQEASSLDPVENRDRLASLVPADADLVVLPEGYARDFGDPGSDLAAVAEPLDGPFVTELERVAVERGTTVVAGLFERGGTTPVQHRRGAGRRAGGLSQDPPLRLLRLPRVRRAHARAAGAGDRRARRGDRRRDDLLRPALPRAGPRAGRPWRRGPRSSPPPGWPARARSTTGRRCCGRGRSRTPCTSSASASPVRATPATRWSSVPWETSCVEGGDGPATLQAELDPAAVVEARRTNPSLANRRL